MIVNIKYFFQSFEIHFILKFNYQKKEGKEKFLTFSLSTCLPKALHADKHVLKWKQHCRLDKEDNHQKGKSPFALLPFPKEMRKVLQKNSLARRYWCQNFLCFCFFTIKKTLFREKSWEHFPERLLFIEILFFYEKSLNFS